MSALLALVRIVPSWCYWILALVALCLGCTLYGDSRGAHRIQKKWDLQVQQLKDANEAALELRREQNRAQAAEQAVASAKIQKEHDDEMSQVRDDLRNSEWLRLGAAWCDGASPAGSTQTSGAGSSNASDSAGRLLPADLDAAVKAKLEEMEAVAATGRAAQRFIRDNGMAPAPLLNP